MIAVRLEPSPPRERLTLYRYRVAGSELVSDMRLPELAAVEETAAGAPTGIPSESEGSGGGVGRADLVFAGDALVAGIERPVRCSLDAERYRLEIAGAGVFVVARDGGSITLTASGDEPAVAASTLVGPPLILALALRGVFCFHASVVVRGGRAVAFLGSSGEGKSTLAALLAAAEGDWSRIADDLLPWVAGADGVHVLPRFPQPGLDGDLTTIPEQLPLAALYVLFPQPSAGAGTDAEVASRPLDPRRATVALVRHTVAARLFAPDLLARHLDACAALAATVPVRSLTVPWRPGSVLAVAAAIAADLEGTAGG